MPKIPSESQSSCKASQSKSKTTVLGSNKTEWKRQQRKEKKREQDEIKRRKAEGKQRWQEYVTNNEWQGTNHKHPENTHTIRKGEATKLTKPKLKSKELDTLPHETRIIPGGSNFDKSMKLYSLSAVRQLARRRAEVLGVPLVWAAWIKLPAPAPVDKGLIIKHGYTPPAAASPEDPPPNQIIWGGEHLFNGLDIGVEDACLTYCLEPKDIDDLKSESGLFDLRSVAVRALEIHGGLNKHNAIVVKQRNDDKRVIAEIRKRNLFLADGQPLRSYSQRLRKELEALTNDDDDWGTNDMPPEIPIEKRRRMVLQYGPVWVSVGQDYDEDDTWFHGHRMPLKKSDLVWPL
ncbi:hypothetical protein VNI00_005972 [Paramarasmius palmivorus]|uniref:Uncharacterized protein n=1 Tax=Paramarasmius palmivorus TaxID=297713 RepID=A0AAW0DD52_9AGAR